MLSEHGADIHISSKGFTPLQIAAVTAQDPVVNALLKQGGGFGWQGQHAARVCAGKGTNGYCKVSQEGKGDEGEGGETTGVGVWAFHGRGTSSDRIR